MQGTISNGSSEERVEKMEGGNDLHFINDMGSNLQENNENKKEELRDMQPQSSSRISITKLPSFSGVVSAAKAAKRLKAKRLLSKENDNNSK